MRHLLFLAFGIPCVEAPSVRAQDILQHRAPPPGGATPVELSACTWPYYLRHLPLRPAGTPVRLHTGELKGRQDVHAAVVDIPTGTKDLQQCADAIIRLRAEFLLANGRERDIAFHLTNGFLVPWERWQRGDRVKVSGNTCSWTSGGAYDGSRAQFERYLEFIFTYAGTRSLHRELVPAAHLPLQAGDVFIQGGSPGHAMIVLDVARFADGRTAFTLGQSYMPAQDFHVVRNPASTLAGPWYMLEETPKLVTPEWTFQWSDRRRWP